MNYKIISNRKKVNNFFTHYDKIEFSSELVKGHPKTSDEKSLSDYLCSKFKIFRQQHMIADNDVKPITFWKMTVLYNIDGVKMSQTRYPSISPVISYNSDNTNNPLRDAKHPLPVAKQRAYSEYFFNYNKLIEHKNKLITLYGYDEADIHIEKETRPGKFQQNIWIDGQQSGIVVTGRNAFILRRCLLPETDNAELIEKWFYDAIKYLIENGFTRFKKSSDKNIKTIASFFHVSDIELNRFEDKQTFDRAYNIFGNNYYTSMLCHNNKSTKVQFYNVTAKAEKRDKHYPDDRFKIEVSLRDYLRKYSNAIISAEQLQNILNNVNDSFSSNYKTALGRKIYREINLIPENAERMIVAYRKKYQEKGKKVEQHYNPKDIIY